MHRKLALFAIVAFSIFVSAALAGEDEAVIARRPGTYQAAIGDPIVTVIIQRPLPNAFGFDDIFGRKVQTGQIEVIFMGVDEDAKIKLRRVDVTINTNASTLTRACRQLNCVYSATVSQKTRFAGFNVAGSRIPKSLFL